MRFVIVTGMSGAGRGTSLRILEDAGYFCVDNLPISLIGKFAELIYSGASEFSKAALGLDIRSGRSLGELTSTLEKLAMAGYQYEILFLDASDEVLIKRYKETRRSHPLAQDGRVIEGIAQERKKLSFLKKQADYIIDTSSLLTRELKQELDRIFIQNKDFKSLVITVLSFGFKYGIPLEADLVFDVRFLPNPYYIAELRHQTGLDKPVYDFVFGYQETRDFMTHLENLISFLLPKYVEEGKTMLVIGIGCTGGQHRSVAITRALADFIRQKGYQATDNHRDMTRA